MKKFLSFSIVILILTALVAPSVYAFEENNVFLEAISYTCTLDEDTGKIVVDGTVNHDVMIKYPGYSIQLYAVAPGEQVQEIINDPERSPLAVTAMTIKFTFSISVRSSLERYSKYAIIFCSENGEKHVAGTPKYPAVSSDFEYLRGDRSMYKGVLCESSALSSDSGAGMVVIDVDMGNMLGETSDSILYPVNDTYISFSRSHVEELDKKIISASVSGAKVYLRFLFSSSDERFCVAISADTSLRGFPNIYDEYTLSYVSSLSKFLMDRYKDGRGSINGVIVGDRADDVINTNYVGDMSINQYADAYVLYLTAVAGAMRMTDPALDIVIPVSDRDEYSDNRVLGTSSSDFLDYVISELEYGTSGRFKCSVLIQSDVVPFGITNSNIADGVDMQAAFGEGKIHADNVSYFADHISKLSKTYVSAPSNVIFMWEPPAELGGSALNASYAYVYYKLYGNADISSFVINASDTQQLLQLINTISYIDTLRGNNVTSAFLKYFPKNTWKKVIGADTLDVVRQERFEAIALSGVAQQNYKSSFIYYAFPDYDVFRNTYAGDGIRSMYSTPDLAGKRALQLLTETLEVGDTAECTYILEYAESFNYTPVISLTIGLDDGVADSSALYELKLTIGRSTSRAVCKAVLESGKTQMLFFDVTDFAADNSADHIRISVRPLTQSTEKCTVRVYELCGYSNDYSNEELASLIEQHRVALRNTKTDDDNGAYKTIISIVCIVFALVAVGAGLFMAFRKEDNERREERE